MFHEFEDQDWKGALVGEDNELSVAFWADIRSQQKTIRSAKSGKATIAKAASQRSKSSGANRKAEADMEPISSASRNDLVDTRAWQTQLTDVLTKLAQEQRLRRTCEFRLQTKVTRDECPDMAW